MLEICPHWLGKLLFCHSRNFAFSQVPHYIESPSTTDQINDFSFDILGCSTLTAVAHYKTSCSLYPSLARIVRLSRLSTQVYFGRQRIRLFKTLFRKLIYGMTPISPRPALGLAIPSHRKEECPAFSSFGAVKAVHKLAPADTIAFSIFGLAPLIDFLGDL